MSSLLDVKAFYLPECNTVAVSTKDNGAPQFSQITFYKPERASTTIIGPVALLQFQQALTHATGTAPARQTAADKLRAAVAVLAGIQAIGADESNESIQVIGFINMMIERLEQ